MTTEELKEKRMKAWRQYRISLGLLSRAHSLCESLEHRYNSDREAWRDTDHQLALIDGRCKVVPPAGASISKRSKTQVDLTEEQIISIALQLGITLPEVEEEKEDDKAE